MVASVRTAHGIDPTSYRPPSPSSRPASNDGAKLETKVSISPEARQRAGRHGGLSPAAHADPALAEQLAYGYAHSEMGSRVDISEIDKGIIRYSATGEIVTPEREATFKAQAAALQEASARLYETEKQRGTAAADIFDKLIELIGSQPQDFRDAINWDG